MTWRWLLLLCPGDDEFFDEKPEMSERLQTILRELRAMYETRYGARLARLLLFGSKARGDADPDSDIDILVVLKMVFGTSELLLSMDTWLFEDYSRIDQDRFDLQAKAARRKELFPLDCRKAFEMGTRFAVPV